MSKLDSHSLGFLFHDLGCVGANIYFAILSRNSLLGILLYQQSSKLDAQSQCILFTSSFQIPFSDFAVIWSFGVNLLNSSFISINILGVRHVLASTTPLALTAGLQTRLFFTVIAGFLMRVRVRLFVDDV
jgi:hypothetical protein